jgi:hypothetical protein
MKKFRLLMPLVIFWLALMLVGFVVGWLIGEQAVVDQYEEATRVCRDLRS